MDMNQYLDVFVEEAKEHLQNLNISLLELEKEPNNVTVLNEIFRVAHTLKGMAGTMGFSRMTNLTHNMENVLDALRSKKIEADITVVDTLFKCLDALEGYVNEIISTGGEGEQEYEEIVQSLTDILDKSPEAKAQPKKKKAGKKADDSNANQKDKGLRLNLNIYDKNVIQKAIEESLNVFQIYVELDNKCLLKSARAFLIFQILDKYSEIMKSEPSVEDIEDERFDYSFTVMVVTKHDETLFQKELNSVAEVRNVEVVRITEEHTEDIQDEEGDKYTQDDKHDTADIDSAAQAQKPGAAKRLTNKTVRVDIDRLDVLMNLVSELIIIKTRLDDVGVGEKTNEFIAALENLERITTSLHDAVMKVRMVPVENVFNRFPRMVRDISKELKKDIVLHMSGEETELDRTVIDEIGEPLIHIIRNSADHGIENTKDRVAKGKSKTGSIWLRAYQDGNNVVIEVEDDGMGIDIEKVRKKIVEKGFEEEEVAANMTQSEVIEYLFKPNFSTADKVTDLSGRGVGLDVVKTKIEALGGTIELETEWGKGSKTIIRLPLTLAIIQALLVMVGSEKYAIPLSSIREINNISPAEIKNVRNQEVILLRDMVIPIIWLHDVLEVPREKSYANKKELTCVIVKKGDKLSGLIVDSLIGQQEIVIKSLGKLLSGIRCMAGATILGDGNVALIVDVNAIV
ncbi:MAG: chemotaxis protein CheA [Clostridiaceae bacterium]|nr:chemotaxis protein CheA [Clostridiaceae bacterium]